MHVTTVVKLPTHFEIHSCQQAYLEVNCILDLILTIIRYGGKDNLRNFSGGVFQILAIFQTEIRHFP